MERKEKIKIKKAIESKIHQLKEDIESLKEQMKPVTLKCVVDRFNKLDAKSSNAIREVALNNAQNKLNILQVLSHRVNEPDFGQCRICHQEINPLRLQYLPESTLCIICASKNQSINS